MQQALDVVEGESELLGTLDEAHYPHRVGAVDAVPRAGPFGFRQQAAAWVPQGLGVDLCAGGDLTTFSTHQHEPCTQLPGQAHKHFIGPFVELPGIKPAPEMALNCENAELDDAKRRESTRNDVGLRERCCRRARTQQGNPG